MRVSTQEPRIDPTLKMLHGIGLALDDWQYGTDRKIPGKLADVEIIVMKKMNLIHLLTTKADPVIENAKALYNRIRKSDNSVGSLSLLKNVSEQPVYLNEYMEQGDDAESQYAMLTRFLYRMRIYGVSVVMPKNAHFISLEACEALVMKVNAERSPSRRGRRIRSHI